MSIVRARGLSKTYKLYNRPGDRLIELLSRRQRHVEFPALVDVDLDVEPGESIGIIGQNGAGKSTLLKLLCGVTQPSSGTVEVKGKIASILELGTGFHPEFSGRDNAALNAAILGLSPDEIKRRLPEIFDFSEIDDFLDRPVKIYSTGMLMRLAFSVAVHSDPDILVVDEALAVGDGHFQRKCLERIRDFQSRRTTMFFCSHAMYMVGALCERTLWLDRGRVRALGPSSSVIDAYVQFLETRDAATAARDDSDSPVAITNLEVLDSGGRRRSEFATGESLVARITVISRHPALPIHLMFGLARERDELICFAAGTRDDGAAPLSGSSEYRVDIELDSLPLLGGTYRAVVYAGDEHAIHVWTRRDFNGAVTIRKSGSDAGVIAVQHQWSCG
jgi:ABC-type polysaccharide/polyol phosphate transport system ATPase subunit